ncbi:MAG TPA: hypothetical protein VHK69_21160 [Chitinophagaceae bacterium]|nr:hypothetical protein [Chitinophagaceae bacterium]
MTWKELKKKVYRQDGSLRDILVRGVTTGDWRRWVDFVNRHYRTEFAVGDSFRAEKIDFEAVLQYWRSDDGECPTARIYLDDIAVHIIFAGEEVLEQDICPAEIRSYADHQKLVGYLTAVSKLLDRAVLLTEENMSAPRETLLIVAGETVSFR